MLIQTQFNLSLLYSLKPCSYTHYRDTLLFVSRDMIVKLLQYFIHKATIPPIILMGSEVPCHEVKDQL